MKSELDDILYKHSHKVKLWLHSHKAQIWLHSHILMWLDFEAISVSNWLNMKIFLSHSTAFDFRKQLYLPIRTSSLNQEHEFLLPHENSDTPFNTKSEIEGSGLVIAEVSYPSTGQGIELGWANSLGIPIFCIYQVGRDFSSSLNIITDSIVRYSCEEGMLQAIGQRFKEMC